MACTAFAVAPASAQEQIALRADVLLYGDNTEFRNPFREGETIFGAAARLGADVRVNPRLTLSLGAFGNQRFGGDDAFEMVRPVVALTITGRRSTFVFGTLPAPHADRPGGPDRMGPHGLIPALQRETLAFDRPYEAGLQWTSAGSRGSHESWLVWQRLNTAAHRERFDAGTNARLRATSVLSFPFQVHVVHQGGQLYSAGVVADSVAAAGGVAFERLAASGFRTSLESFAVAARDVPDRERPDLSRTGRGMFTRAAIERAGWRAHLIVWRARDFIKDEGDANYLSLRRDGSRYGGTRDYAELGLSRRIPLAPGAALEISGRLHRTERYYEYSYRVTSSVNVSSRVR